MTPLTLETFDNRLVRMVRALFPRIGLKDITLTPEQTIGLRLAGLLTGAGPVYADNDPLSQSDAFRVRFWSSVHIIGRILDEQASADDLTAEQLLFVAIVKYRTLVATRIVDEEGDTVEGQLVVAALSIGVLAAQVLAENPELDDILGLGRAALDHRKNRQQAAKAVASAKVDRWHPGAIEKAKRMRVAVPRRPSNQIADAIHSDDAIDTPSYEAVLEAVRLWSKDGTVPARAKGKK